ncbi:hypothetical protein [Microvirga guangxiensis]|uniref:Beta-barrel assembly machine subunit BamE n=1 Tax=Microvirga guangxiensis TaxID=549386 RepID=A0A1G5BEC0_9HYPH|nr:hypothetical protein [Microvirga guangxiensis]SCX88532.1 hypothetical protein SAMN02927923_00213 [Microvirga guangxiensis]
MRLKVLSCVALAALGLSACNSTSSAPPVSAPLASAPVAAAPTGPTFDGPLLGPDGRCTGPSSGSATVIEPGISECDLVRLKGKPATDVLVGESGKGQREVQVLYSEPGGRELYFFVNNRLDRIAKP